MSHNATNIILLDGYRGPGTYAEALLVQSHQKGGRFPICQVLELWMVYERKRDLLKDHPRHFGIGRQSKHNGSGSLLAQPSRKSTAPREARVNRRTTSQSALRCLDNGYGELRCFAR